jgi:hypothetical protein
LATVEQIKQEIIDWVNQKDGSTYGPDEITRVFYDFFDTLNWRSTEIELPSGTVKLVEAEDAGEGDYSADIYVVFSVNGQYFRVDGHYESWAGSEWDANDLYECAPVQVLVTQFQRKVL